MFAITPLHSDFELANALVAEALGAGWYTVQKLEAMAAAPNARLFGARDEASTLLGVANAIRLGAEDHAFYRVFGGAADVLEGKQVGSLSLSAVVPEMRGRGLGSALMRARLDWLREQGCNYAVGISWKSGLAHTSQTVFDRHDFTVLATSDSFFEAESQKYGHGCPVCGSPCRCRALFYGRAL
jgi:GNAT superfamily N-acetyltransferase